MASPVQTQNMPLDHTITTMIGSLDRHIPLLMKKGDENSVRAWLTTPEIFSSGLKQLT
jgi:3-deoxy-D-arabino-heptulosonate 7-phosphate (DAHP) synthase